MKKLLLIISVTLSVNLTFAQMTVSKHKNADKYISDIEKDVKTISNRRDLESKSFNVPKVVGKDGKEWTFNNSAYWDKTTGKVLQINQRIYNASGDIVSYYFKDESLIKVLRYRMIEREPTLIGEYHFSNGVVLQKREHSDYKVDPKNILRESQELIKYAYKKSN